MRTVIHRCKSEKNMGFSGSRDSSDYVPCDGAWFDDGTFVHGCGEPCRFVMGKEGEGEPPLPENFNEKFNR